MILVGPGGDEALALYVRVEVAGEQPRRILTIDQKLRVIAGEVIRAAAKGFPRPLAIGGIGKARDIGVLGDAQGTVFTRRRERRGGEADKKVLWTFVNVERTEVREGPVWRGAEFTFAMASIRF